MPLNINTSNYINTQGQAGSSQALSQPGAVSNDGVVISVKGLDLNAGQTISGQVIEMDGGDIKLLLSNNQTINAKLEGNINVLLGQTLSFEVKNSENGQTALRPLYTNLDNSLTVSNALSYAGLPKTAGYMQMVSSMMDEGMSINKNALYDMAKQINSFPNASPDTLVRLTKLGLPINELTISQYENYKGLTHQITGDVNKLTGGLSELLKDTITEFADKNNISLTESLNALNDADTTAKFDGKTLLTSFLNQITGKESYDDIQKETELPKDVQDFSFKDTAGTFDMVKTVLEMADTSISKDTEISDALKELFDDIKTLNETVENDDNIEKNQNENPKNENPEIKQGTDTKSTQNGITENSTVKTTGADVLSLAKEAVELLKNPDAKIPWQLTEKLTKMLASKEFNGIFRDNVSKQMLLKPEEVINSKTVEDLYLKISNQANRAVEILQASGRDNPEMAGAAKNISDNVNFMNELNQVVTYVQLPLLMNNRSAHGDLYVYTKKKNLKDNDGNISALLHLDMENLGPMDVYVQLTNATKLNTHFYLQDDKTIDFIEAHIDILNKRLQDKGYDTNMNISVKDMMKEPTDITKEFMKDDPKQEGMSVIKYSFDVRA